MIISFFLLAITVSIFMQPNMERFAAAVVFVCITMSHEIFMSELDGILYYASAAFFDFLIILILGNLNPINEMNVSLCKISLISIFMNSIGWVIWYLGIPPKPYNLAYAALYFWALMVLVKKDCSGVGNGLHSRGRPSFCFSGASRVIHSSFNNSKI